MKVTSEQLLKLFGLKVGDRILYDGFDYTVIENNQDSMMLKLTNGYCLSSINNLLNEDYEIIINPKPTLTDDEKVILRNLDDEYNYIMRDEKLWVSKSKPDKGSSCWASVCKSIYLDAFPNLFKFITWEDEEPYNIKELLDE